jgi:lipid A 3-O-deacylase
MKKLGCLLVALLLTGNAWAVDGVSFELGNGDYTDTARIGAIWNWKKQWFTNGNWLVTGFLEASAGSWRGKSHGGNNQTITDLGITPVFRFQQKNPSGIAPYLEGAIGFHLISPTYVYATRRFGSAFQFGDHVGFGVRFGDRQQFDLGYRLQHLSNGDIKEPNTGIDIEEVRFAYRF